jgi:NADH-quinone oxidoreductase subunit E
VRGARRRRIYRRLQSKLAPTRAARPRGDLGPTGSITLEHAECLAACDLAPVLQVNYEFYDNQTSESGRVSWSTPCGAARSRTPRGARRSPTSAPSSWSWPGIFPDLRRQRRRTVRRPLRRCVAALAADRGWAAPADARTPPALPERRRNADD